MSMSETTDILKNAKKLVQSAINRGLIKKTYSNIGTYRPDKKVRVFSEEHRRKLREARAKQIARASIVASLVLFVCQSFAAIDESKAVRAIVGEAANQGRTGMLAVAGAIRNRGTLKGVYGVKNPAADKQPAWVWQRAREAWSASATNDITRGATNWENTKAFGTPYWAASLTITTNIGAHTFFK